MRVFFTRLCTLSRARIHLTEVYPFFLAYENSENAHKNGEKGFKNLKSSIHNAVSAGTKFPKKYMAFFVPFGLVKFVRYCGKM